MLINELKKCIPLVNNDDHYTDIFLAPYYIYMEHKVQSLLSGIDISFSEKYSKDLAYQIVRYVYKNYLQNNMIICLVLQV